MKQGLVTQLGRRSSLRIIKFHFNSAAFNLYKEFVEIHRDSLLTSSANTPPNNNSRERVSAEPLEIRASHNFSICSCRPANDVVPATHSFLIEFKRSVI